MAETPRGGPEPQGSPAMEFLDTVRENAQSGTGPCEGCSAHQHSGGQYVNPGLGDPDADLAVVTGEPTHAADWDRYDDWAAYNEVWRDRIRETPAGERVETVLGPLPLSFGDVWLADAIKCPTHPYRERDISGADTEASFAHCGAYLAEELERVDPGGVLALGKPATQRTLRVLGVGEERARRVQVTTEYGRSEFLTEPPVVVAPGRTDEVPAEEWLPTVRDALRDVLG